MLGSVGSNNWICLLFLWLSGQHPLLPASKRFQSLSRRTIHTDFPVPDFSAAVISGPLIELLCSTLLFTWTKTPVPSLGISYGSFFIIYYSICTIILRTAHIVSQGKLANEVVVAISFISWKWLSPVSLPSPYQIMHALLDRLVRLMDLNWPIGRVSVLKVWPDKNTLPLHTCPTWIAPKHARLYRVQPPATNRGRHRAPDYLLNCRFQHALCELCDFDALQERPVLGSCQVALYKNLSF